MNCLACGGDVFKPATDVNNQTTTCANPQCTASGLLVYWEVDKCWYIGDKKLKRLPLQFSESDLEPLNNKKGYWGFFAEDLASDRLFPNDYDNNEVLDRLGKAGVITKKAYETGSEWGELFINFNSKKDALAFLDRLNAYLRTRWWAIKELKRQLRELP